MANEIDLVVGSEAFSQITRLLTELGKVDTSFTELSAKFAALGNNTNTIKSTADLAKLSAENAKLNAIIEQQIKDFTDLNDKLAKVNTTRASSIKGVTEETIAQRELNAQNTLNIKATTEAVGAYAKLDAQHKLAVKSAQDLAASTGRSTAEYEKAKIKANELGNQLRVIDTDIGKHTRNVGNYSSQWNGLGNSINQLTREAPAFANSVQTGFMALSNNIPILTDELGVLIQKNKDLQKDGKPTQSILETLSGAFFSWQTVISLGVTILTVYGSKLIDIARGLGDVQDRQEAFKRSQAETDNAIINVTRNIQHQAEIRKQNLIQAGAAEELIRQSELQKEKDIQKSLVSARDVAKEKYENAKKYVELDNKAVTDNNVKTMANNIIRKKRELSELRKLGYTATEEELRDFQNNAIKREAAVKIQGQKISELLEENQTARFKEAQKAQEKLDKLADKPEKKVLKFDEVKSENDLKQAKIETDKIRLQSADLDRLTTEEKIINREKLTLIELDAIEAVRKEEVDVANKKQNDDKVENDRALRNKTISEKQYRENIEDIDKTHKNVLEKINVEASNKTQQLAFADFKYQADLLQKDADNRQKHTINQFEAEKLVQKQLSEDTRKNSDSSTKERIDAFNKFKEISEKELISQRDSALSKTKNKEEQQLINDEYEKGIQLLNNMATPLDAIRNKTEDWLKGFSQTGLDSPLKAFGMESAKMFLDFDENNETTFSKMYDNAEKGQEKFKVAFTAISEVGQGAFNAIAQASMAQYEQEYARLEAQKETSIKFAGDSVVAKERIEEQYAQKKKEIDKKRFESEKKISMVNIVIDTAQAVMATLGETGFFGSPLAIIVAALGAAQLGMVAAQQFPAYAEGTDNHSGGLMLVNDGAGSNYQEKVILPSGKVIRPQGRNVLMDAPKGTKVLNHEQQLFEMLQSNNISMSSQQSGGMTPEEMDEILGKHFGNIKTQNTIFDKNGFQSYVKNGNSITRSNSNRSQAIGISV